MAISGKNTLKYAAVDENTAATNEIVAAVAGRQIVVINYTLVTSGDVAVNWESGTTNISGVMDAGAAAVIDATGSPESPLMATALGEALALTLSAAVQVGGHVTYIEVH